MHQGTQFLKIQKMKKLSLPENSMFASNILLIVALAIIDVKFLLFK